jgi:hypothetical protein
LQVELVLPFEAAEVAVVELGEDDDDGAGFGEGDFEFGVEVVYGPGDV